MPRFLRAFVPGGMFFFTLVTNARRPLFEHSQARTLLRRSIAEVRRRWPFQSQGIVLLPDPLHCVLTLPQGDADFSIRLRKIKEGFSRAYLQAGATESMVPP